MLIFLILQLSFQYLHLPSATAPTTIFSVVSQCTIKFHECSYFRHRENSLEQVACILTLSFNNVIFLICFQDVTFFTMYLFMWAITLWLHYWKIDGNVGYFSILLEQAKIMFGIFCRPFYYLKWRFFCKCYCSYLFW
jgi:hypothetical protein